MAQRRTLGLTDESVDGLVTQAEAWGKTAAEGALSAAAGELGSLGTLIIGGSVFFFGVIFFLLSPDKIWGWVVSWPRVRARRRWTHRGGSSGIRFRATPRELS